MKERKARLQKLLQALAKNYPSKSELARVMDISVQALGTYFRGECFPRGENFYKIANFMGMSIEELTVQLLGVQSKSLKVKEKRATYPIGNKAEDFIPIVAQLPDSEKIRLARLLLNVAVN